MFSRTLSLCAITLAGISAALGSGVLVPLYIDPFSEGASCEAWIPLLNVISANPTVPFYVIVNPDSGPDVPPEILAGYQACIPRLRAASEEVTVVGYVRTGFGSRSVSDVNSDVATYAGWGSTFRPQGIFFDEVNPTANFLPQYTTFANTARTTFNSGSGYVILNPGSSVGSQTEYFNIANQIVTAENVYSQFSTSQLSFSSSSPAAKQAVILTDAPVTPPASLISELVSADGIGLLYITDDTQANNANPYDTLPTQFGTLVADIAADS